MLEVSQESGFDIPDEYAQYSDKTLKTIKSHAFIKGYGLSSNQKVAAQEILDDGTVIQSGDFGVRVLGPDGKLRTGSDAEATIRKAREFEADQAGKLSGAREGSKLTEQLNKKPTLEGNISTAKSGATATSGRLQGFIDDGVIAAEAVPLLKRSVQLLEVVKTGGVDAAGLRAKQIFGVEGADEAELAANMGKAVLAQLRPTFGAAFTEREGQRLERLEASFSKSSEGNKRILGQMLKIFEREARRGISAAKKVGDNDFVIDEIETLLNTDYAPQENASPQAANDGWSIEEIQ